MGQTGAIHALSRMFEKTDVAHGGEAKDLNYWSARTENCTAHHCQRSRRKHLMKYSRRKFEVPLAVALLLTCGSAFAQSATVTLSSAKQYIRGFGGMNHAAWAGDLTAAE